MGRAQLRAVLRLAPARAGRHPKGREPAAAQRLLRAVAPDDVVGRFGGYEFVILVFGEVTTGELQDMVGRVRLELATPMSTDATSGAFHASIGVVHVHQGDQRTADEILRDADRAMYEAKCAQRGQGSGTP